MSFLLLTYVVSGLLFSLLIHRFAKLKEEDFPRLLLLAFPAGPVLISWVTVYGIKLFPENDPWFYVSINIGFLGLLCIAAWPARGLVINLALTATEKVVSVGKWSALELALLSIVVAAAVALLALSLVLPLYENDALQYVFVASKIIERASISFYPVVPADPETGFYAVSSHPAGLMGLYAWTYLAGGGPGANMLIKLAAPIYVLYTIGALICVFWKRRPLYWLLAAIMILSVPLYVANAANAGIDSFRICLFFCAALWLGEYMNCGANQRHRLACILGVFCGLSMYSHSISMALTLPLLGATCLLYWKLLPSPRFIPLLLAILLALVIGGEQAYSNYLKFGAPIYDTLSVTKLAMMEYADFRNFSYGIFSRVDEIFYGLLAPFSRPSLFGLAYWSLAFWPLCLLYRDGRTLLQNTGTRIYWTMLAAFFALAIATLIAGSHAFVGNARYLLSMLPFVVCLGAMSIGFLYERTTRMH